MEKTRKDRDLITLDDHLCNTSASQSLAPNEFLTPHRGKRIEKSSNDKENSCSNQTASSGGKTNPLDSTKNGVNGGPHPVGGKAADEFIEFGGCWANSEEEGHLNEEDDKGRSTSQVNKVYRRGKRRWFLQADHGDDDMQHICGEDVRNTEREAENNAKHSSPTSKLLEIIKPFE